jgi:hypothetical protein
LDKLNFDLILKVKQLCILGLVSFFAGLINPFHILLYREFLTNLGGSLNFSYIAEWRSINFHQSTENTYGLVCLLFFILLVFSSKKKLLHFLFTIPLIYTSFTTQRSIIVAFIPLSIFLVFELIDLWQNTVRPFLKKVFQKENNFFESKLQKYTSCFTFLSSFIILLVYINAGLNNFSIFSKINNNNTLENPPTGFLPAKILSLHPVVDFMKSKPELNGKKLFNYYTWGGFLSFYYPEGKTFIDGRMSEWKCYYLDKESILETYTSIASLWNGWEGKLDKLNVDLVLMPKGEILVKVLNVSPKWKIIYSDDLVILYQRV